MARAIILQRLSFATIKSVVVRKKLFFRLLREPRVPRDGNTAVLGPLSFESYKNQRKMISTCLTCHTLVGSEHPPKVAKFPSSSPA